MKTLIILVSIVTISLGVSLYALTTKRPAKQAYVINQELFDGFNGKQQLESKLKVFRQEHKLVLDSMASLIRTSNQISLVSHYNELEAEYASQEQQMSATYTVEIWKQINQYISAYGDENDFDYIYGAAGEGTLMYADEANNITEEIVLYINQKYEAD